MRRLLVGIGVIVSLTGSGAQAQEPADVGVRVRLHSVDRDAESLVGMLVSATPERFVVREESGNTAVVSTSAIRNVEVSEGLRGQAGPGVLIGFMSGAAIGAMYGENSRLECGSGDCSHDCSWSDGEILRSARAR